MMNAKTCEALVTEINKAKVILENIDWNFYPLVPVLRNNIYPFNCRKHHWFPATFIPEIPFTLIEVLTLPGAVVYDPFAGIGTTYFQALLLNRRPLVMEICRVAIEFMKSLLLLFNPKININNIISSIIDIVHKYDDNKNYISDVPNNILIDELEPWYSRKTLNQLSFLFIEESRCNDPMVKAAMRISISAILRSVSSQDRGWGCIADNVLPKDYQIKDKNAIKSFVAHVNKLMRDIANHLRFVTPEYERIYREITAEETIFYEDVRKCKNIPDNSVDLVITSPPYPNMTDYVKSQRLSYYFFGFDLYSDLNLEIGARHKRHKKDSLKSYLRDMVRANKRISEKVKEGGYVCYIMPIFNVDNKNNIERKRVIQEIMNELEGLGLIKEAEFERIIPTRRRAHNKKWATLEREKIYIYRKV